MRFSRTKKTKRFSFQVNCNSTTHRAGANNLVIETRDPGTGDDTGTGTGTTGKGYYSFGTTDPSTIAMTIKEAKALQGFLNKNFPIS
tara:strand:- start:271 stop:531 length:261 start_codon:yes stop_codon:yes gene_type:complete